MVSFDLMALEAYIEKQGIDPNHHLHQVCRKVSKTPQPVAFLCSALKIGGQVNNEYQSGWLVDKNFSIISYGEIAQIKNTEDCRIISNTPLAIAVDSYDKDSPKIKTFVKALIKNGADLYHPSVLLASIDRDSPIMLGIYCEYDVNKLIRMLLHDPIYLIAMVQFGGLSHYFLDFYRSVGGKLNIVIPDGSNILMHCNVHLMQHYIFVHDPKLKERVGELGPNGTLLHYAVCNTSLEDVKDLVDLIQTYNLDPLALNAKGNTPMMELISVKGISLLSKIRVASALLPLSRPIRNHQGQTALQLACEFCLSRPSHPFETIFLTMQSIWERNHALDAFYRGVKQYLPIEIVQLILELYPLVHRASDGQKIVNTIDRAPSCEEQDDNHSDSNSSTYCFSYTHSSDSSYSG